MKTGDDFEKLIKNESGNSAWQILISLYMTVKQCKKKLSIFSSVVSAQFRIFQIQEPNEAFNFKAIINYFSKMGKVD